MRLFVASTREVGADRAAIQKVAELLNRRHELDPGSPLFIDPIDWRDAAAAAPGSEADDVFVALAWLRFDDDGEEGPGGTEAAFARAVLTWPASDPPRLLLYRCMRLPGRLHDIDGRALSRVEEVLGKASAQAPPGAAYREYLSSDGFAELLERDLTHLLQPRVEESRRHKAAAASEAVPAPAGEGGGGLESWLRPGEAYDVAFLSVEIAGHAKIAADHAGDARGVATLLESFRRLVRETAASYGGDVIDWQEAGGTLLFWRRRCRDHAIMSALKVLHNLPILNLDLEQNPLGEAVRARCAAHDAVIVFRLPPSSIESADRTLARDLESQYTAPGELTVSKRLLAKVDPRLRSRFHAKGRFGGEAIFVCRLPAADQVPQQAALEELSGQLGHQIGVATSLLEAFASAPDAASVDAIGGAADEAYATLNRFGSRFSYLDSSWPRDFLAALAKASQEVLAQEAELWRRLRLGHAQTRAAGGGVLEATVKAAARRRARAVVILEKLAARALAASRPADEAPAVEPTVAAALETRVDALLRADDLDRETAVTELLLNHKVALLEALTGSLAGARRCEILDKLWLAADLVLLDDLYSIRGHRRASDIEVSAVLSAPPVADRRFAAVRDALYRGYTLDGTVDAVFSAHGVEPTEGDRQMAWRCLLLGQDRPESRATAAFRLTPASMWEVLALPNVPIPAIHAIGDRIRQTGNEDAQKIFFDCTRARIEQVIEAMHDRDEVREVARLMHLLLHLPHLVESGYFERLDDMLGTFLARTGSAGVNVEYFESLRKTVEAAHKESDGKGGGKLPEGVKRLPLTLQRRLAGEPRYLMWFVTHPDPRIAGETLRHIGLENVEPVLRLREVNGAVFHSLLKKNELFTRSQTLLTALNHPKCDQNFASRYVSGMARSTQGKKALEALARNSSANPAVRGLAQRALQGQGR
jgi:hypothetical protein